MIRTCAVCEAEYEGAPSGQEMGLTCSPACLDGLGARFDAVLTSGATGPFERGLLRRLSMRRFPPVHAGFWMARSALVLARLTDRYGSDGRWQMLPVSAATAASHASECSSSASMLDVIRARYVLGVARHWLSNEQDGYFGKAAGDG